MASPSIVNMHFTQDHRERQADETLSRIALKKQLTSRIEEARNLWGSAWDNWWDVFLDDHDGQTWGELHDALVLEIERRKAGPVDGDAYQNWISAMSDVDRMADAHSPDTAAAIKIEQTAHRVYLQSLDRSGANIEITP